MQIPTAQAIAPIQYPKLAIPYFLERRGSEWFPDTYQVALSTIAFDGLVQTPTFGTARRITFQGSANINELLDWDFVADPDPALSGGKLSVKLVFSSRLTDTGLEERWD